MCYLLIMNMEHHFLEWCYWYYIPLKILLTNHLFTTLTHQSGAASFTGTTLIGKKHGLWMGDIVHWWQQFGLNRECCVTELQHLSRKMSKQIQLNESPLLVFKGKYTVLFEC